jgi:benzoate transport
METLSLDNKVSIETFGRRNILTILLCMIFNIVDGFDITAMAIAAVSIGEEMQIDAAQLGLVFSFSLAGMMAGATLLAPYSDIIGRRRTIIVSLLVIGATVLLTAFVSSLIPLITLRFISGLGAGVLLATQTALAAEYSPAKYRALAVTAVTAGYPMGAMMTGLVASSVMPDYGWRGLFLGGGAVTLLMAVVAIKYIPESIQFLFHQQPPNALAKINRIFAQLRQPSIKALPAKSQSHQSVSVVANMKSLLAQPYKKQTLMLWLIFLLSISSLYFLMSWIPKLILLNGFSKPTAYLAFTLFNMGGVVGIFSLGFFAAILPLRSLVSAYLLLASFLMVIFSILPSVEKYQLIIIFIIGLTQQGGYVGIYAMAAKLYPTHLRGTGVGWAIGIGRFGAVIGPAIAGYMIAMGVSVAMNFVVFALPLGLAGVIALKIKTD